MKALILLLCSSICYAQVDLKEVRTKYGAFFNWIGNEETLENTTTLFYSEFTDFDKLAQIAAYDYLVKQGNWEIYQEMDFDLSGKRIPARKKFIVVAQDGHTENMIFNGFYFLKKKIGAITHKIIVQVYENPNNLRSYMKLYFNDASNKVALKVYSDLMEYTTTKNIYKGGVLDSEQSYSQRIYKFLGNVHEYDHKWESLILNEETKKETFFNSQQFIKDNDILDSLGLAQKRGIVFWGPPGTGKSFVGQILISSMLNSDLKGQTTMFAISARHLHSTRAVSQLFRVARQLSTSTIFMEDIDLLGIKSRNNNSGNGSDKNKWILNEFLNGMDGVESNKGVLVIGTTNRAKDLDSALTRSGRLGVHIYYGLPSYGQRKEFFERFAKKKTLWSEDLTLEWLAGESEGLSGADIIELIGIAKQESFLNGDMTGSLINLNKEYFKIAINQVRHPQNKRDNFVEKRYSDSIKFLKGLF